MRGTAQEFATLVEDVKGHALTLTLLGGFLERAFHGDIRQRDRVKFEMADEKMDGGHAFRTMAAYEQWLLRDGGEEGRREVAVLRLMGLFDRPADAGCLAALLKEPVIPGLTEPLAGLADDDWEYCLSGLETAKLLTVNRDTSGALLSLDTHPHIREYFAAQVKWGSAGVSPAAFGVPPKASSRGTGEGSRRRDADDSDRDGRAPQTSEAWRAAHRRLYEHLCASTPDKPQPKLEDLQPLYQAVAHGCQAGLQQEAYDDVHLQRIRRGGQEDYSVKKLGAFGAELGALACFFEQPWSQPSSRLKPETQAILLGNAGFRLRASGRLVEALEPMRATQPKLVAQQDWRRAARNASNLSELELTLGEVAGAVGDAEQSVTYADRSGDAGERMINRTTHADALHQAGRRADAETRFREAEQMQQERQSDYPLLYSLRGFLYCDLLLAAPERAAWQIILGSAGVPPAVFGVLAENPSGARSHKDAPSPREEPVGGTPTGATGTVALPEICRAVSQRAAKMFEWRLPSDSLLDIALDHLTLGRAALYAAILSSRSSRGNEAHSENLQPEAADDHESQSLLTSAATEIDAAVAGLRRANRSDYLPRGLLTRAWLRFLTGARTGPESAQEDLDEA
jgi:hypothetical protein